MELVVTMLIAFLAGLFLNRPIAVALILSLFLLKQLLDDYKIYGRLPL